MVVLNYICIDCILDYHCFYFISHLIIAALVSRSDLKKLNYSKPLASSVFVLWVI